MSQAKVDRYKQEKANRAKTMKKQKQQKFAAQVCVGIVGVALCVWIGFSVYDKVHVETIQSYEVNLDALVDYQNSLTVE